MVRGTHNPFLDLIDKADLHHWCTRPWCTTCGARPLRDGIRDIPDLQAALESIDIEQLTAHRDWADIVHIMVLDHWSSIDWDPVLERWLPYAAQHATFADRILFTANLVYKCSPPLRERWFATCIDLALRTKHDSLLETLLLTCAPDHPQYAELLAEAKSRHAQSRILQRVMKRLGHLSTPGNSPADEALDRERKRKVAGHNLFNAIRRNDTKAVKALLSRKADLTVKNQDGLTLSEYGRSVAREEIVALIEAALVAERAGAISLATNKEER